ncbi:DNA-methyltransferase [Streptomyces sp. NPDC057217]|uniref:DNA-methyltransferase n=1 Tax=Streptomyces sp. NPDC057217 TaxID=3346054 RepID=UPI0036291CDD
MSTWELIQGEALAVLRGMPDESVDVILTDPPFSSGGRRESARSLRKSMIRGTEDDAWIAGDAMSTNGFLWIMREVGWQARRVLKPGGHLLAFIDWRMAPTLSAALESADLRQHPILVWDKTYFGMGSMFRNQHEFIVHMTAGNPGAPQRRDVGNVIPCKPIRGGAHPTEKPVPLLRTLLSVVCPGGGTVVDPFAGSGATGVAALEEGHSFIGVELSDYYARVARERLAGVGGVQEES